MTVPRVVRNDWSRLEAPALESWRPSLRVSVVIPAYQCQAALDLVLAALAGQTYPAELLEVIVVDDGSTPPLVLPEIRPRGCRLVRVPDEPGRWGRANALNTGAAASSGDVIHWLDGDMVVFPEHVAAQARWHHVIPYAVTLGYKRFVDVAPDRPGWPTASDVARGCARGTLERLFGDQRGAPHDYVERLISRTDQLRGGDHLNFLAHVGATAALRRELYLAAGGLDTTLRLGEDTEYGYRLAQAGAVFIPEPAARSWHLGRTNMMRDATRLRRYNRPFLADRMPYPRYLRREVGGPHRIWSVPLVTAVVDVAGRPWERVRAAVDGILAGDEADVRVDLVGPWDAVRDGRTAVLGDPLLELRLAAAAYRGEPRVRLVTEPPRTAFPAPYLLRVPVDRGLSRSALRRLVEAAERDQAGLVRVSGAGAGVELWRTSALHRAQWVGAAGESLDTTVAAVHGVTAVSAEAVGIVDLAPLPVGRVTSALGAAPAGRWLPASVEVAGVRSLALACLVVGDRLARRGWLWARRLLRRPARAR